MGLRPDGDDECIQEVARVEEEDGGGGWVALWRPSRTPPKRGRLSQSAEWELLRFWKRSEQNIRKGKACPLGFSQFGIRPGVANELAQGIPCREQSEASAAVKLVWVGWSDCRFHFSVPPPLRSLFGRWFCRGWLAWVDAAYADG